MRGVLLRERQVLVLVVQDFYRTPFLWNSVFPPVRQLSAVVLCLGSFRFPLVWSVRQLQCGIWSGRISLLVSKAGRRAGSVPSVV